MDANGDSYRPSRFDFRANLILIKGGKVNCNRKVGAPRDGSRRAEAQTFRQNPESDIEFAITELGVGETLVTFLDKKGRPNIVAGALTYPPHSQLPPMAPGDCETIVKQSTIDGHSEKAVDRQFANEMLKACARTDEQPAAQRINTWQSEVESLLSAFRKSVARGIGSLGRLRDFGSIQGRLLEEWALSHSRWQCGPKE